VSITAGVWSVPVRIEDIPETGRRFELSASEAIRGALARVAGVDRLARLDALFDVVRHGRDGLRVTGTVSAAIGQTCVVTLEPIETELEERVDLVFLPPGESTGKTHGEVEREGFSTAREPPEVLTNGTVDLGALATEFLILGIDPYPRKAGAEFAAPPSDDPAGHPFAALAALKAGKRD
jgi:uncharacterized metal-binding protein YceD (DUF177 family)